MKKIDIESDLSIDKFKLDNECVTHSVTYYRYCELQAEAKNDVGVLSDALKLKMGECNIEIRNEFIKKEIKFTEAVIASEVEKDDSIIEARDNLRKGELEFARIQAAVSAMEHRKSQLDNLVKLYCAGYFSTVSGGKPRETVNEMASREARQGLNRRDGKGESHRMGTLAKPKKHPDEEDDE